MEPKDRLKEARLKAGYATPSDAARSLKDINKNTLISNENGNRPISRQAAVKYGKAFDVEPGWILYGEAGSSDYQNTVRLVGYIGAGQAVYPLDDGADDEVEAPSDAKPTTVAAQIRGDSMLPLFHEDWLIYWSTNFPPEEMINQLCVVQVADGRLLVKTLRRGSQDGLWTLTSFNASDITDVPVDWVAKIDWIKPR